MPNVLVTGGAQRSSSASCDGARVSFEEGMQATVAWYVARAADLERRTGAAHAQR